MAITPTAGFVIESHVLGDNSVTLKWSYGSGINTDNIVKLMVFYNDTTVRPTGENGNLAWIKQDVNLENISLKSVTINSLTEGEDMVFYLAAIVNNMGGIATNYSAPTDYIRIVSAPTAFVLPPVDGRDLTSIGTYNIYVDYPDVGYPPYDKIVFMLIDNASPTPLTLMYEFSLLDGADSNYNSGLGRSNFSLTNLDQDKVYEISGFGIKSGLTSNLSNTRYIIASQKTSYPTKPSFTLDYTAGTVQLISEIESGGVVSEEVLLNLYSDPLSSGKISEGSISYYNELYGAGVTFPVVINELYDSATFNYAALTTVAYTTSTTGIGETAIAHANVSDAFYLMKQPAAPIIQKISSSDGKINVYWTDGDLFNGTVYRYDFVATPTSGSPISASRMASAISVDEDGHKHISGVDIDGLTNGMIYTVTIRAVILDPNSMSNGVIEGIHSVAQNGQPFTTPTTLPVTISYAVADVNGKAMLSWTAPVDSSSAAGYLQLKRIDLFQDGEWIQEFVTNFSTVSTVTINSLVNGTSYNFGLKVVVEPDNYNNHNEFNSELINTSIIPWSLSEAPLLALDNEGTPSVGNHYVKLLITDSTGVGNGITTHDESTTYKLFDGSTGLSPLFAATSTTSTKHKLANLTNDQIYNIKVLAKYLDPNVSDLYHETSQSTPAVAATPAFIPADFATSTPTVTNVGSNSAKIQWDLPSRLVNYDSTAFADAFNLTFTKFIVKITDVTASENFEINVSDVATNFLEVLNDNRLINGHTFTAKVTAEYDGSPADGTQSEFSAMDSANFYPFTTYAVQTLELVSVGPILGTVKGTINWEIDNSANAGTNYVSKFMLKIDNGVVVDVVDGNISNLFTTYDVGGTLGQLFYVIITSSFLNPNTGATTYVDSSSIPVTLYSIPPKMTLYRDSLNNNSAGLRWVTPTMNDVPFYYVISQDGTDLPEVVASTDTSLLVSSLTEGTEYDFQIRVEFLDPNLLVLPVVVNEISDVLPVTPYSLPVTKSLTGFASNTQVTLTIPADTSGDARVGEGGLQIKEYNVVYGVKSIIDAADAAVVAALAALLVADTNYISASNSYTTATDNDSSDEVINAALASKYAAQDAQTSALNAYDIARAAAVAAVTEVVVAKNSNSGESTQKTISGLQNGTLYAFKYRVVTDNTVNSELPDQTSAFSPYLNLTPYTDPAAPSGLTIDFNAGQDSVLSWNAVTGSDLGGMALSRYQIFVSSNGGTSFSPLDDSSTNSYTYTTNTNYGAHLYFKIQTCTTNSNNFGSDILSVDYSNVADKILFEAPKTPLNVSVISVKDASADEINFSSDYEVSVGLVAPKFKVSYYKDGETYYEALTESTLVSALTADIDGVYTYKVTQFVGGILYNATVSVEGTNPNDVVDILTSDQSSPVLQFGTFDDPVLSEFYVNAVGDRFIDITLNGSGAGLNLNFANFDRFEVYLTDITNDDNIGTVVLTNQSYLNYRITLTDHPDNIALLNEHQYRLTAKAFTTSPVSGYINDISPSLASNMITVFTMPRNTLVPVVVGIPDVIDTNTLTVTVNTFGLDVLNYECFVNAANRNEISPYALLFYDIANAQNTVVLPDDTTVINSDIAADGESTPFNIVTNLENITFGQIDSMIFRVKTANGWSETFFSPAAHEANLFVHTLAPSLA